MGPHFRQTLLALDCLADPVMQGSLHWMLDTFHHQFQVPGRSRGGCGSSNSVVVLAAAAAAAVVVVVLEPTARSLDVGAACPRRVPQRL